MQSDKIKFPEEGELVIGTVTKVFPYGAFVKLDEYTGKDGMIHISEISTKWIKNIGDYVKEGEKIVVKILKIDQTKGHIDLSLKSVKAIQKKQRLDEYQKENRAKKLLELAGNKLKDKEGIGIVIGELEKKFGGLYPGLEAAVEEGAKVYEGTGIPDKWKTILAETAKSHVTIPKVSITANLELHSKAPNGVEVIRGAFAEAEKACTNDEIELSVKYVGAPNYRIDVKGKDYKALEACLEKFSGIIIASVEKAQGEGKLIR